MRLKTLAQMMLLALIVAACGGGDDPSEQQAPTATPTLTAEERAGFPAGSEQNPFQMVFVPTTTVNDRVELIVATLLDERPSQISAATNLSTPFEDPEFVTRTGDYLRRDFDIAFAPEDAENMETVADLSAFVHEAVAQQAEAALFEFTRLNFDVVLVANYGQALDTLCQPGAGIVSVPWLDGMTYFAAQALNCGQPSLQDLQIALAEERQPEFVDVEIIPEAEATAEATSETADGEQAADATDEPAPTNTPTPTRALTGPRTSGDLLTGDPAVLIVSDEAAEADSETVSTGTFCRISVTDFYSWFVPTLIFERDDIQPENIVEVADVRRLVDAVADGDCTAASLAQSAFNVLEAQGDTEGVMVAETTPPFPFGVMMYPLEVGLGERVNLSENLPRLAEDAAASRPLRLLLGQDAIVAAPPDDFSNLGEFIASTGVNLELLSR